MPTIRQLQEQSTPSTQSAPNLQKWPVRTERTNGLLSPLEQAQFAKEMEAKEQELPPFVQERMVAVALYNPQIAEILAFAEAIRNLEVS